MTMSVGTSRIKGSVEIRGTYGNPGSGIDPYSMRIRDTWAGSTTLRRVRLGT